MFDSDFAMETHPVIQDNLIQIDRELYKKVALTVAELSSLADEIAKHLEYLLSLDLSVTDAFMALRETLLSLFQTIGSDGVEYPMSVEHFMHQMRENDRAVLISLLLEKLVEKKIALSEEDFLLFDDASCVFAYVKNTLADEAYDVITENVPDARVRYVSSFSEGVRALLTGEVGYLLLPIEEKGGLRLPTVENLLFTENLKIRRIVPVFGFDGAADIKYAMISKTVYIEAYQKEDDRYLEIHIPAEDENFPLSSLLFAITLYGMHLYRIHSVSTERSGEIEKSLSLVLKSQGESFVPLLSYLTLFFENFTVVGIYKNLEY